MNRGGLDHELQGRASLGIFVVETVVMEVIFAGSFCG